MRVIVVAVGSAGDVHPFLGLAIGLRGRGHRVEVMANPHFRPLVERLGFEAIDLGTEEEYRATMADPDLWHPFRAFNVVSRSVVKGVPIVYEAIASRYVPGETVVVSSSLGLGARIAQEALGVPLATVHLQPSFLRSYDDTPTFGGLDWLPRAPRVVKWLMYKLMDRIVDRRLGPGVNAFRGSLGLRPTRRFFGGWIHSPRLVLGLWPDWFGPPQPEWPPNVVLAGFPLFDERGVETMPEAVEAFLNAGEPPIVFAPGSANVHARPFFEAAVEACRRLGRRGVLVTRFPEQVPEPLPPEVRHFAYVPFSALLPRAAALVHHGGIGTMAQALAAGVPQLVRPLAHDQFDNAARAERLGVARSLLPRRFDGTSAAERLRDLLGSSRVAERCREVAGRFEGTDPIGRACEAIEGLALEPERSATATG